jgi:hypothetical protein
VGGHFVAPEEIAVELRRLPRAGRCCGRVGQP